MNAIDLKLLAFRSIFRDLPDDDFFKMLNIMREEQVKRSRHCSVLINCSHGGFNLTKMGKNIIKIIDPENKYSEYSTSIRYHSIMIMAFRKFGKMIIQGKNDNPEIVEIDVPLGKTIDISDYDGYERIELIDGVLDQEKILTEDQNTKITELFETVQSVYDENGALIKN